MERCSPVEMRKNLLVVEQFKKIGIDFAVIPVIDSEHKLQLITQGEQAFETILAAEKVNEEDE